MPAISQVMLNDQEMEICRWLAEQRLKKLEEENASSGKNWTGFSNVEKEAMGFMGEVGFNKLHNTYFHMDIVADKDVPGKRGDAKLGTHWIDVKTLTKYYPNKRLIVPKKRVEEYLCDYFALCSAFDDNLVTFFGFFKKESLLVPKRLGGPKHENEDMQIPYPGWIATEFELTEQPESMIV
jgi:hypothetical protein